MRDRKQGPEPRLARHRAIGTLVMTLLIVVALGLIGLGVEDHLRPTSLEVAGTSSARGEDLAQRHFGDSSPIAVMLRGPAGAVERQGRVLAAAPRPDPPGTRISPRGRAPAPPQPPPPPPRAAPGAPPPAPPPP